MPRARCFFDQSIQARNRIQRWVLIKEKKYEYNKQDYMVAEAAMRNALADTLNNPQQLFHRGDLIQARDRQEVSH